MKTCTQCKEEKPVVDFYPRRDRPGSYRHQCKTCDNKRSRAYNEKHRVRIAKARKEWLQTEEGKAKNRENSRRQLERRRTEVNRRRRERRVERLDEVRTIERGRYHSNPRRKQQVKDRGAERRARTRGGDSEVVERQIVWDMDAGVCHLCL